MYWHNLKSADQRVSKTASEEGYVGVLLPTFIAEQGMPHPAAAILSLFETQTNLYNFTSKRQGHLYTLTQTIIIGLDFLLWGPCMNTVTSSEL